MQIHFLGAARGVTGSMHLIEANGQRVLLDCGMFQGRREEAYRKNRELRVPAQHLDAIVLSHAHIDHAGNIPTVYKLGFRGKVHATRATADLADLMLRDSAQVQLRDVKYLERKHERPMPPLYTATEARDAVRRFRGWDYDTWFDVGPGIRAMFKDAGHILGSASVHLEIREKGKDVVRITFTGDFGRPHMPILRDPAPLPPAEIVITESTYGDRLHGEGKDATGEMKASLLQCLKSALDAGGKLIIPAFSVGRTQMILYLLNELIEERLVPKVKVFVDSPLSAEATEVVCRHPECFDGDMLARVERSLRPVMASHVELCRTVEESKKINRVRGTSVIISASGMCEYGRVLHHLLHNLEDERTVVAFVGWQAEHTLGRKIVERQPRVRIYGNQVNVKAQIVKLNGFSAHADRDELVNALWPLRKDADRVFVVHGEEKAALAFSGTLTEKGFRGLHVPAEGEVVAI